MNKLKIQQLFLRFIRELILQGKSTHEKCNIEKHTLARADATAARNW